METLNQTAAPRRRIPFVLPPSGPSSRKPGRTTLRSRKVDDLLREKIKGQQTSRDGHFISSSGLHMRPLLFLILTISILGAAQAETLEIHREDFHLTFDTGCFYDPEKTKVRVYFTRSLSSEDIYEVPRKLYDIALKEAANSSRPSHLQIVSLDGCPVIMKTTKVENCQTLVLGIYPPGDASDSFDQILFVELESRDGFLGPQHCDSLALIKDSFKWLLAQKKSATSLAINSGPLSDLADTKFSWSSPDWRVRRPMVRFNICGKAWSIG